MNKPQADLKLNRRHFLGVAGTALAFPTLIPSSVLGRQGNTAPSERVVMGMVGCGVMGTGNTNDFLAAKECQVVAACDVDKLHLATLVKKINNHYQSSDCKAYHDYREVMARKDVDAVM